MSIGKIGLIVAAITTALTVGPIVAGQDEMLFRGRVFKPPTPSWAELT